ncbi:MAG: tRNA (adenosine(37)-N6)-threonylcarbamoyltransferase complex transferase subunit TsaD [Desulfovibrio sp.]|jgi:N6-L-threonylcarbamoyladenine synthase|nr:tRNA (adenosine(37)-N6)-threonylcarbamoyltransferase complex transferase subunit TsaD [Desulfovibrio sp.]
MLCLGIETSCDDTSLALVKDGRLLAQESAGQADLHALFGGVVPELASREHARFIGPLCDKLLRDNRYVAADLDLVAVARGPGLLGSLLVGIAFAKSLAVGSGALFIGVNHLHAHLLAAGLEKKLLYPALGLLVSGGHTHLYRVEGPAAFSPLGKTLDDAAGEAFDKAGKMLGLPYPAGRQMDFLAGKGRADPRLFPRPHMRSGTLDFSFSGLKTAMRAQAKPSLRVSWDAATGKAVLPKDPEQYAALADCCASFRLAVVETLAAKMQAALDAPDQADIRCLLLAGGVAANSLLRASIARLAASREKAFLVPAPALCADNGAMVAYLGGLLAEEGFCHPLSMEAVPRGRPIPDDMRRRIGQFPLTAP